MVKALQYSYERAYTRPTHVESFTRNGYHFFGQRKIPYKKSGSLVSVAHFSVDDVVEGEIAYEPIGQKKRILLVSPPASIHTRRWYEYLSHLGYEVSVAAFSRKGLATIELGGRGRDKEEQIEKMPLVLRPLTGTYDVVHVHFATRYGHVLEGVKSGPRKILSVWGEDALSEAKQSSQHEKRLRRGIEHAERLTTTSRYLRQYLSEEYDVDERKIWTFPWGYRRSIFFEREVTDHWRLRELGIEGDKKIVLSARVCRPHNNIDAVIHAFKKSGVDAYLVVLTGDLQDSAYTQHLESDYLGERRILFLPTVSEEDLALLYNRAEVAVSLPLVDNLSTTILESMACGTPVIGSDIPPYKERIISGENGLLVNPHDDNELSAAIRRVVATDFKSAAKEKAKSAVRHDSWEENARNIISVYDAEQR